MNLLWAALLLFAAPQDPSDLRIHEWGTFTVLQDERGAAIGGINTDDEPVPEFVHQLNSRLLLPPTELPLIFFKGAPRVHPDVTLRLETPVIYFHLPADADAPLAIDLKATLREGWLTEFYPHAEADAPGLANGQFRFQRLSAGTKGSLSWKSLNVGTHGVGPRTEDPVWTAPRKVDAAPVTTPGGESEKFVFYRGVARLDAPIRVARSGTFLELRSQIDASARVPSLWLVDVRRDGTCAFRPFGPLSLTPLRAAVLTRIPSSFPETAYSSENLPSLRRSMRTALISDGLHLDEAEALLNTWEVSYFKSPGLRLFFMVPRSWTDRVLPLEVSVPAKINRVFVGRIEIVTPEQRRLLKRISQSPRSHPQWINRWLQNSPSARTDYARVHRTGTFEGTNAPMPRDYRAYLDLGRLRNALILDELKRTRDAGLNAFIKAYDLGSFRSEP